MKKSLKLTCICFVACFALASCDLPGFSDKTNDDDDFLLDTSYSDSDKNNKDQSYSWVLEPTIQADNIISFDSSQIDPENEQSTAYLNMAIIYQKGKYGFIDNKGNIVVEPTYDDYYTSACGEMVLYNVINEQTNEYEYCTLDSAGQVLNYTRTKEDYSPVYYWNNEEKAVYVKNKNKEWATKYSGKKTVVVTKAKFSDVGNGYYTISDVDDSVYALAKEDKLILDFEYSDFYAPAFKGSGLTAIALQKDGKWGYVSSQGDTIVDFKCDSILSSFNGNLVDDIDVEHPYLFTEEFVPVSIDSMYGYYDMEGECVVKPGEFEQARPVHNGRAWVRKNGLWGVIQLAETAEEESSEEDSSKETTAATKFTTQSQSSSQVSTTSSSYATTTIKTTTKSSQTSQNTNTTPAQTTPAATEPPVVTTQPTQPPVTTPQPEPPVASEEPGEE